MFYHSFQSFSQILFKIFSVYALFSTPIFKQPLLDLLHFSSKISNISCCFIFLIFNLIVFPLVLHLMKSKRKESKRKRKRRKFICLKTMLLEKNPIPSDGCLVGREKVIRRKGIRGLRRRQWKELKEPPVMLLISCKY